MKDTKTINQMCDKCRSQIVKGTCDFKKCGFDCVDNDAFKPFERKENE